MENKTHILNDIKSCLEPVHISVLATMEKKSLTKNIFDSAASAITNDWHYHLLITTNDFLHKNSETLQENIESKCAQHTSLSCWVIHENNYTQDLLEGDYFYQYCKSRSLPLLEEQHSIILREFNPATLTKPNPAPFVNRAIEFMATAELLLLRNQPALAAFQLHQAAEQSLTAMIFGKTGYRPPTHNLLKLNLYAQLFNPGVCHLLSIYTSREQQLLQQLQKAYIGSRYNPDFTIKTQVVRELYQKFLHLLNTLKLSKVNLHPAL